VWTSPSPDYSSLVVPTDYSLIAATDYSSLIAATDYTSLVEATDYSTWVEATDYLTWVEATEYSTWVEATEFSPVVGAVSIYQCFCFIVDTIFRIYNVFFIGDNVLGILGSIISVGMSSVLTVANWSEFRMASFKNSTSRCPSLKDSICGGTESSCNIAIRRNPSSRDSMSG
jgi:hypothetical protein